MIKRMKKKEVEAQAIVFTEAGNPAFEVVMGKKGTSSLKEGNRRVQIVAEWSGEVLSCQSWRDEDWRMSEDIQCDLSEIARDAVDNEVDSVIIDETLAEADRSWGES
jgi:hypothetical protein